VKITKTRTFAKDHLLSPVFQQLMTMTLAVHSLDKLGHVGYVEAKSPLSMPSMAKRLDAGSTFPCLYRTKHLAVVMMMIMMMMMLRRNSEEKRS
jgi:hypothetical protein